MTDRVVLVDVGTGNLHSVQHALQSLGVEVLRTNRPEDVKSASRLVLPGVGAFGNFMKGMETLGLTQPVKDAVQNGVPLLGICVGMQAFFDVGLEMGVFPGLGLIPGKVVKFQDIPGLKVPHTGWNQFRALRSSMLLGGLTEEPYAYFNHSYYCQPANAGDSLAETDYGIQYTSIVQKDNLFGVQFHPEKSQRTGLALLANFLKIS
ncbi:MAG: imidazole glycerol phosphate synthase subunit HisH [Chloroflexi bacterium HGW-Chloroflexi-4]|jgi:glutamine amidotransferase|nr:MAG: imidazole glycerol phosphate synthase subunit HisH [Chloroflexi bacterium HGW-Chloroflexi-4]